MSYTPEHAILASLDSMRLNLYGQEGGPRAMTLRARLEIVGIVKRAWPGRQLSYVRCDAEVGARGPEPWHWAVLATEEAPGRWSAHGVAGGSGRGDECLTRGSPMGESRRTLGTRRIPRWRDGRGRRQERRTGTPHGRRGSDVRGQRGRWGRPPHLRRARRDADAPRPLRCPRPRRGYARVGVRGRVGFGLRSSSQR